MRRGLTATQVAFFSEETPQTPAEEPKPAETVTEEPTAAEIAKGQEEWGIKYDDECLKFEKEWKVIAEAIEKEQMIYLESELSDLQKKKVEMIADKVIDMNMMEQRYMHAVMVQRVQKATGLSMMKLNLDWPSLKQDDAGTWPPANPNWFKQQELMSSLGPFMGSMGGGGQAAAPAEGEQAEAAPAEEAAPKEKTHYDIELSKYDPAGKIKVIKEIRAIFNLGLKEAKETVEGAPVWLKKEVAKEEAEALAEKLKAVGAEIRLA